MTNIDYEKIGSLIKMLREDNNLTLSDLAVEIGVSRGVIGQWESGTKGLSISHLYYLSKIFNVSINELVDGKLNSEKTIDYLKRNFDLDSYNINELISSKNEKKIEEFLIRCTSMKNRFYGLLLNWANGKLSDGQKEEFKFIKDYMLFDKRIFGNKYIFDGKLIRNSGEDLSLKEYINSKNLKIGTPKFKWELSKLFNYKFDFKPREIIELGFENCSNMAISLLSQQQLDELLSSCIHGKTSIELTDDHFIGLLIIAGANCVYRMSSLCDVIDEELLPFVKGDIVEDKERTKARKQCVIPGYDYLGKNQVYSYEDEWKSISFEDYQDSIMKKKTKYIQDLFEIKYSNPKKFYENLKNDEYDTYL